MILQHNVSLNDKNWFQTGGCAQWFCEPSSLIELEKALKHASCKKLPLTFIGEGANILISDEGVEGLVIRPQYKNIRPSVASEVENLFGILLKKNESERYLYVEAGLSLHDAIEFCLDHNLGGLEEFSGIPGTIGGSTFINVHYFHYLLSDFIVGGYVVNALTGKGEWVLREWFDFGYDQSRLHEKKYYLGALVLKLQSLTHDETLFARGRRAEIIRHRNHRYPTSHTCGSFFRNFHEHEITQCSAHQKVKFVAYYLDVLGLKGSLRYGGAMISRHHANMIVNFNNATSEDIISLARLMQKKVYDAFGIFPQPECQLIGFSSYPLLNPVL